MSKKSSRVPPKSDSGTALHAPTGGKTGLLGRLSVRAKIILLAGIAIFSIGLIEAANLLAGRLQIDVVAFDAGIAIGGAMLTAIAAFFIGRDIALSIAQVAKAATRLADNDSNIEIMGAGRGDEIGTLWRAIDALKTTIEENQRLTQMVDQMPINVMMANPDDLTITYVNKTSI